MDLFWLDKLILNSFTFFKHISWYNFFILSIFAWGVAQALCKDGKKK